MLKAILNKGGAGKSITRAETAERLSALMHHHHELMYAYDAVAAHAGPGQLAAGLEVLNKTSRADIGKLSEIVLSNGGTPPLGTNIDPEAVEVKASDSDNVQHLLDLERAYRDALKEESDVKHTFRAVATLENTLKNTENRIQVIQRMGDKLRLGLR